jgi:choice-of-anchor B domain-containing protein
VDPDSGREFIASGLYDGVAFLEILHKEGKMIQLGFLPSPAPTDIDSLWKEVRGYKHYMLIGSELANHGIQIFDMTKLLDLDHSKPPTFFDPIKDCTGYIDDLPEGASHNVVAAEESEFAVAVGSRPRRTGCKAGLIIYDMKDPSKPTLVGCNGDDGYVHDAQCLVYRGPDERYAGRDICYAYNEDSLTIYDVTNRANSSIISITSYEGASYTHQGWVLDTEWQEYLFMNDEFDEVEEAGLAVDGYPVTYIWDIRDLEKPKQTGFIKGTEPAVDHNLYVTKDKLIWQSNYNAGLRVYDVSSVPEDPTGNSVCEIAYFDIFPDDDANPSPAMYGSWSSFLFPSGFAFVNTIERGGYLVKMTRRESCPKKQSCNGDNCLRAMRAGSIEGRLEESQEFCAGFTDGWTADVGVVPTYAAQACGKNVISRVSSACSCLPTPTGA